LRRNAQLDQAQTNLNNARLQLAQLRENVQIQYQQAIGERRRAQETISARQQTVTQAQRVYDLMVLRYDRGLATQLDVSDARLALLQARTNLAQALSDFYVAEATVNRALGGSAITTGAR
jgi:outer membrane protein TolC